MMEQRLESSGSGLLIEDLLPLAWHVPGSPLVLNQLTKMQEVNEEVLRIILSLDESHSEPGTEHGEIAHDLVRLEFKLNLVLDMVGRVLSQHLPLPPPVPVRLNAKHVAWQADDTLEAGTEVVVQLYLCSYYPRSISLCGQVDAVKPQPVAMLAEGGANRAPDSVVQVTFHPFSSQLQDLLEQFIFRQHRRQIANLRRERQGTEVTSK